MALFIFPVHHFRPTQVSAAPVPQVISGGTNLNNDETVIQTDGGGRWAITYSGMTLRSPFQQRLWDSWVSYLRGGARAVLCPILSLPTAPRPLAGGGAILRPSKLAANDDRFPTSVSYASPYIVATVIRDVAARATTMTLNVSQGARIEGGEKFEISGRGFVIERVLSRPSAQSATVIVSPPARAAIASGSPAIFDWPKVQAKAATGQTLAPDISFGRTATASISFVEDFSDAN